MDEYENKFNALSRFILTLVNTAEKKCRCFLERLQLYIRDTIEPLRLSEYADMVDRALEKERWLNECQKRRERKNQRTRPGGPHGKDPNNKGA